MAVQSVHQADQLRIVPVDRQAEVAQDDLAVLPALLVLQASQVELEAVRLPQPVLVAAARQDHLARPASQLREKALEQRLVRRGEHRLGRRSLDATGRLEVVPDEHEAVRLELLR